MSPSMKELLRTTLADEEPAVAVTVAVDRAIALAQNRRRRRYMVASGAVAALAASIVTAVTLWPDGAPVQDDVAVQPEPRLSLPAELDLSSAAPVAPDDELRMIFQSDGDTYGRLESYGLTTTGDVVRLTDLPALPTTTGDTRISLELPAQLAADGSRLLLQRGLDQAPDLSPLLLDPRTGVSTPVPWKPEYRAAGLSPDGSALAVVTFAGDVNDGVLELPWRLVIVDVATGTERAVPIPEVIGRTDTAGSIPPSWSSNGDTVRLGVARPGGMVDLLVSLASGEGSILQNWESSVGTAPWSPDGNRLLTAGTSSRAYRVLDADPDSAETGAILAAGPVNGRSLLGWSGAEHLLWFDATEQMLVETDLSGTLTGAAVPIRSGSTVVSVVLGPIGSRGSSLSD